MNVSTSVSSFWSLGRMASAFLAGASLLLSSCATTTNKPSPPPPLVLDLIGTHPDAEVTLHTVIVPGGPNAWTPAALWDEYVLTIVNRSSHALTFESAKLADPLGNFQMSGGDANALEKTSLANWKAYRKANVAVSSKKDFKRQREEWQSKQASGGGWGTAVGAVVGTAVWVGSHLFPITLLATMPLALSVHSAMMEKLKKEIADRQLAFPLTLPSGSSAMGSVFFPMTPSPGRFVLQGQSDGKPIEIDITLNPLAQLHLIAPR